MNEKTEEQSILDTIVEDENVKEGAENVNKNEFTDTFEKQAKAEKDKKKQEDEDEESEFDLENIDAKEIVNIIDFLGQMGMPFLSASLGGKRTAKEFALKPINKKLLEPRVEKVLEEMDGIKMKPGPALMFTLVFIYGTMALPDLIEFVMNAINKKKKENFKMKIADNEKTEPKTQRQRDLEKYKKMSAKERKDYRFNYENMSAEEIANFEASINNL